MFYTYCHTKPNGTIFYVGKGSGNRAWQTHSRNKHWKNIVLKYKTYNVEILANWDLESEANDHEILLISCFKDMGYVLANMTNGGEGLKGLVFSQEHKNKLKLARIGKTPMKGKKHSMETRLKMSKSAKRRGEKNNVSNRVG